MPTASPAPAPRRRDIALSLVHGVAALVKGARRTAAYARSDEFADHEHFTRRVWFTPGMVVATTVVAWVMSWMSWPVTGPLYYVGVLDEATMPGFDVFLELAAVVVFAAVRDFAPQLSSRASCFFDVLRTKDPAAACRLEASAVLTRRGRTAFIRDILFVVAAVIAATVAFVLLAPVLAAGVALLGPLAVVLGGIALAALIATITSVTGLMKPLQRLWQIHPFVFIGVFAAMAYGAVSFSDVTTTIAAATRYYYASQLITTQALVRYSDRLSPAEWARLCDQRRWEFVGFGAPVYAVGRWGHPLALVVGLQAVQAAAAELVEAAADTEDQGDTKGE